MCIVRKDASRVRGVGVRPTLPKRARDSPKIPQDGPYDSDYISTCTIRR